MKSEKAKLLKDITNYDEIYKITTEGDIYRGNQKLSPINNGLGYYQIKLRKNGKRVNKYVHRLVWETFNGNIPNGYEINHIDHDKSNNSLANLK